MAASGMWRGTSISCHSSLSFPAESGGRGGGRGYHLLAAGQFCHTVRIVLKCVDKDLTNATFSIRSIPPRGNPSNYLRCNRYWPTVTPIPGESGRLGGKNVGLVIERLRVRFPAQAEGEFSSPELTLCADFYSVFVPLPCYRSGT